MKSILFCIIVLHSDCWIRICSQSVCNVPTAIVILLVTTMPALCEVPGVWWWGQSADHLLGTQHTCLTCQCVVYYWESRLCLSHLLIAPIIIKWLTERGIFKLETNKMSPWLEWRWKSGTRWDLKGRERINSTQSIHLFEIS